VHPHGLLQLQPEQSLHDAHAQDPVSEIKIILWLNLEQKVKETNPLNS